MNKHNLVFLILIVVNVHCHYSWILAASVSFVLKGKFRYFYTWALELHIVLCK